MTDIIELAKAGWALVPWSNRKASKRCPLIQNWQRGVASAETVAEWVKRWTEADWAIRPIGAVVLDLENKNGLDGKRDLTEWAEKNGCDVRAVIAGCAITKTFSDGRHIWFRLPDSWDLAGSGYLKPGIEIKSLNCTAHVPPSDGYEWVVPLTTLSNLPLCPQWILDEWKRRDETPSVPEYKKEVYANGHRRELLCSFAAKARDSLCLDEHELSALLLAVRKRRCAELETFSEDEARAIAVDFSKRVATDPWGLALAGDPVAQASIRFVAKANGMVEPAPIVGSMAEFKTAASATAPITRLTDAVLYPTPMIERWVKFVDSCNVAHQPSLTLLSVVSTIGALMGRRYKWNNSFANVYCLGLAESTCGKDALIKGIARILKDTDNETVLGAAQLGSDAGLLNELIAKNEIVWPMDEIAFLIKSLANPNAPDYTRNICKMMLTLYSGGSYTKVLKDEKYEIRNPCPNIFGVAQPGLFWSSINPELVDSGFLGRFIVFNGEVRHQHDLSAKDIQHAPIPDDLLADFDRLKTPSASLLARRSAAVMDTAPGVMGEEAGARELYHEYQTEIGRRREKIYHTDHVLWTLLGRDGEKLNKLAMMHAWSINPDAPIVTKAGLEWGMAILKHSAECVCWGVHHNMSASKSEGENKSIFSIIAAAGPEGISKNDLTRMTQRHRDVREKALADLEAAGQIVRKLVKKERGAPGLRYIAITTKEAQHA